MVKSLSEEKRLRDIVKFGDLSKKSNALRSNISLIDKHLKFIRTNLERTERNLVLYNLLKKTRLYLYCLMTSLDGPTEQLGFITRILFELNLLTRYVLMDEDNLKRFVAQTGDDKIKILEGILEFLQDSSEENAKIIEEEINRIKTLKQKHNLTSIKSLPNFKDIARIVGLEKEYKALYKLFSKYVHPTPYIINGSPEEIHGNEVRNIFLIHAQLYAGDTFQRIKEVIYSNIATTSG